MAGVRGVVGRAAVVLGAAMVLAGGCDAISTGNSSGTGVSKAETSAAVLRQGMDSLLQEHVMLTCAASDAALAGRDEEYNAASVALNDNAKELEGAIRAVYGTDAGSEFYDLCHRHDGLVVDYMLAVSAKDEAKENAAVSALIVFAGDFGTFVQKLTDGRLPKDTVADLVRGNIASVKGVIDAQAARDYGSAFGKERDAEKQITIFGNTFANAIVLQYPDKY